MIKIKITTARKIYPYSHLFDTYSGLRLFGRTDDYIYMNTQVK